MTDIPAHELPLIDPHAVPGAQVLEFGDKRNPSGLYREWYTARGCDYQCIDINGRHGAHAIDVRAPFDLGQFDVVTNFGFSEHVSEQAPFWRNHYAATKVGGVMVGTTPLPGEWVNHAWSYWHPSREFYEAWAHLNALEVVTLITCGPPHRGLQSMIGYVLRRTLDRPHRWSDGLDRMLWRNRANEIPRDGKVLYG